MNNYYKVLSESFNKLAETLSEEQLIELKRVLEAANKLGLDGYGI
jgi:hypothetical protein